MRQVTIRRRRVAALGVVVAGIVVLVVLLASSGGSDHKPLPEGGSSFGAQHKRGGGGSLLDVLAPVLAARAPRQAVLGTHVSSAGHRAQHTALPLPLDRAAAQLFLVGFEGAAPNAPFFQRLAVRDWGGVVLDRANYVEPGQLAGLAGTIAGVARGVGHELPLVAARQPGGTGTAFPNLPPKGEAHVFTPAGARRQAELAGRQLRALGIVLTLAPDGEVATGGGPWEGRAFSDDPARVSRLVRAAVAGYAAAHVAPAPGNFPGEGAASGDSTEGTATVGLSVDELRARDIKPFAAVAGSAPAIAMSDALYAGFDGVTPATLLPEAVALLRKLGFRGVVVSGDLSAATLATGGTVGAAAVDALKAGCDLLYVPGDASDQEQAWAAVVRAVRRGDVPVGRVAAALARVAALKRRLV